MSRARVAIGVLAVVGAVVAGALVSSGNAATVAGKKSKTISMTGKTPPKLDFDGPERIRAGAKLNVVNRTDPEKVGPHTFTLIKKRFLPADRKEAKKCFDPGHICEPIAEAHEVDFETEEVNKAHVEVGKKGWDKAFTMKKTGDSEFLPAPDQEHGRRVKARPGTTLYFFCVIHPTMQGKIKVVD